MFERVEDSIFAREKLVRHQETINGRLPGLYTRRQCIRDVEFHCTNWSGTDVTPAAKPVHGHRSLDNFPGQKQKHARKMDLESGQSYLNHPCLRPILLVLPKQINEGMWLKLYSYLNRVAYPI